MQYIGRGAHIRGIPARDLSRVEVLRFGGEVFLRNTGLYRSWPGESRQARPGEQAEAAATPADEITEGRLPVEEPAPPQIPMPSIAGREEPRRRRKHIQIEQQENKENEL